MLIVWRFILILTNQLTGSSLEWTGGTKSADPLPTTVFDDWSSNTIQNTVYMSNLSTVSFLPNSVGQIVCEKPIGIL